MDREEAVSAIERYLLTGDGGPLRLVLEREAGSQCVGIGLPSGGAAPLDDGFERFVGLALSRGLVSKGEAVRYLLSPTGGGQL